MHIDNSRYTAFLANPEKYRLTYELNLVPKDTPFALARGIHFHELNEARNKGLDPKELAKLKNQAEPVISTKAKQSGEALFKAFKRKYDGHPDFELAFEDGKPLAEMEFDIPIPGSPHYIIGRMDEVIAYKKLGGLWISDTKTCNNKCSENKKKIEFNQSSQPLFYINAARMLGYDVRGMLFRVVTEHNPPQHYVIPVEKSERQLQVGLVNIHQVAEQIEMMRHTFGIDNVWPHVHQTYPCNYPGLDGKPTCEYAGICQMKRSEMTEEDLQPFTNRIDHIDLMKGKENNNDSKND